MKTIAAFIWQELIYTLCLSKRAPAKAEDVELLSKAKKIGELIKAGPYGCRTSRTIELWSTILGVPVNVDNPQNIQAGSVIVVLNRSGGHSYPLGEPLLYLGAGWDGQSAAKVGYGGHLMVGNSLSLEAANVRHATDEEFKEFFTRTKHVFTDDNFEVDKLIGALGLTVKYTEARKREDVKIAKTTDKDRGVHPNPKIEAVYIEAEKLGLKISDYADLTALKKGIKATKAKHSRAKSKSPVVEAKAKLTPAKKSVTVKKVAKKR